jgi:Uncharacterized protein conserved in bacteria (DUF2252)
VTTRALRPAVLVSILVLAGTGGACSDNEQAADESLARAHARTRDRVAIAAHLGNSDNFDRAILAFSQSYAEQNDRDFRALREAADSGRIVAEAGL